MPSFTVLFAAAGAIALAVAGCGGSSKARTYVADDLAGIVAPKPPLPNGRWHSEGTGDFDFFSGAFGRDEVRSDWRQTLKEAGFQQGYGGKDWSGNPDDGRSAKAFTFLFRDAQGASKAFAEIHRGLRQSYSRNQAKPTSLSVEGFGDESFGIHSAEDRSTEHRLEVAWYVWRIGNVVFFADMECDPKCGFDVIRATRAYAAAIDARAKHD